MLLSVKCSLICLFTQSNNPAELSSYSPQQNLIQHRVSRLRNRKNQLTATLQGIALNKASN